MAASSALVINHRVMPKSDPGHKAIGGHRVLYIANRPDAVVLKTEDDLRIERENELMAKMGYLEFRPGSKREANRGHALFDQHGIPERRRIQRELVETGSAIITSVVSVRREDAEALGLATKLQWERFLRGQWSRYVESLGVMEIANIRWVAAFHVNQQNNLHCHVLTWDSSGKYGSLLPKQELIAANEMLSSALVEPLRQELNLTRTQARDELTASIRAAVAADDPARLRLQAELPEQGSLKYASLRKSAPAAAEAADLAVQAAISRHPEIARLYDRYLETAREHARLKSLSGASLEAHMASAEADITVRMGNAAISAARPPKTKAALVMVEPEAPVFATSPDERIRERMVVEEMDSILGPDRAEELSAAILRTASSGGCLSEDDIESLRRLPSVRAALPASGNAALTMSASLAKSFSTLARMTDDVMGLGPPDPGEQAASALLMLSARLVCRSLANLPSAMTGNAQRLAHIPKSKLVLKEE